MNMSIGNVCAVAFDTHKQIALSVLRFVEVSLESFIV